MFVLEILLPERCSNMEGHDQTLPPCYSGRGGLQTVFKHLQVIKPLMFFILLIINYLRNLPKKKCGYVTETHKPQILPYVRANEQGTKCVTENGEKA